MKNETDNLIDTENKLMLARWEGVWEMVEKVEGIKKYKLAVTKQS